VHLTQQLIMHDSSLQCCWCAVLNRHGTLAWLAAGMNGMRRVTRDRTAREIREPAHGDTALSSNSGGRGQPTYGCHRDRAALLLQPSACRSAVSLKFIDTGWMLCYTPSPPHSGLHRLGLKRRKRVLLAVSESTVGPLGFWKYHESPFQSSANFTGVLYDEFESSSVPVECMFSTTRLISNGKRSSTAPDKLNRVLFVHDNFSLITNDSC